MQKAHFVLITQYTQRLFGRRFKSGELHYL